MDGMEAHAEDSLLAGLLPNLRFDPKDPDSYFNWHETRGIPRSALESLYADPKSKVRDLERLYRKAGINIRDLKDLLDEAADSTTLAAVFAANKKAFGTKPGGGGIMRVLKVVVGLAALIGAIVFLVLPFIQS